MSGIQPGRVSGKAAYVRGELAYLRRLRAGEAWTADPTAVRAARYSLQTAVTALTDVAYHVCAKRLQYAPQSARDAFRRLAHAGAISDGLMSRISTMIGFRNLAVHGYEGFDDDVLRKVVRDDLNDLDAVLVALEAFASEPTP